MIGGSDDGRMKYDAYVKFVLEALLGCQAVV